MLLDTVEAESATGRSSADAPEIDGVVHISAAEGLRPGDFAKVRITDADEYDLFATVI